MLMCENPPHEYISINEEYVGSEYDITYIVKCISHAMNFKNNFYFHGTTKTSESCTIGIFLTLKCCFGIFI